MQIVDIEQKLLVAVVRDDVVDFSGWDGKASAEAVLAQRMGGYVVVPEGMPAAVIAALRRRRSGYLLDNARVRWC